MELLLKKIEQGVFYTIKNCFNNPIFIKWFKNIPHIKERIFIEPFAGENNIIQMIREIKFKNKWKAYDINRSNKNVCPDIPIVLNDSINNYIGNLDDIVITNPPYLAKNSASRKKIFYPKTQFDDLYKLSLDIMLKCHDYVIAIIPESFITANLFKNRIDLIISINHKIFNDTTVPCCIACLSPSKQKINYNIYSGETFLFNINEELFENRYFNVIKTEDKIIFNSLKGQIGCICIDGVKSESIKFVNGNEIKDNEIKVSSRAKTRIFVEKLNGFSDIKIQNFIENLNIQLYKYRNETKDVFLTSFKGLRIDNKYRRRIDFKTIKNMIIKEIEKLD